MTVWSTEADAALLAIADLYRAAIDEMIDAVRSRLESGQRPRKASVPSVSYRSNGMAHLSDASAFTGNGPMDYVALLEPPYGDEVARRRGRFQADEFPRLDALVRFFERNGGIVHAYPGDEPDMVLEILLRLQVSGAVNLHMERHGPVGWNAASDRSILRPVLRGIADDRLDLAIVVPVALTRFEVERFKLAPDIILMRMSDGMQRARWSAKAYSGSGHDTVLAAASHAIVVTGGWGINNGRHWQLAQRLAGFSAPARQLVDSLFAALRLVTGFETGYAQLLWLPRHWRIRHAFSDPEVHAAGARRYPEAFDDFGWNREDLPTVTREQLFEVATTYAATADATEPRLALALRRLNSAMTRDEPADAILDATIGLELLLGDREGQAISWKLRMRAAALAGLDGDSDAMRAMERDVSIVYGLRSAIVHGAPRGAAKTGDPVAGASLAVETLRRVLRSLLKAPRYLQPLLIDRELLMRPAAAVEGSDGAVGIVKRGGLPRF